MQRLVYKMVNLHLRFELLAHSSGSACLHKLSIAQHMQWHVV